VIKLLPPGLHVILGDSAGGIFTRVFFARDRLLIDQDVLSCGPTPACADLADWSKRRFDYWSSFVPGGAGEHEHSRFNLVDNAHRLAEAERVHIWAATGVSEQLFIAFVVHLVKWVGGDPTRISLVECEMMNNRRIMGLGELDDAQMRAAPDPRPMHDGVAQQYLNAWAALTSADPMLLAGFAREHPEASRWLKLAMQLMTRRFPDQRTGLSYWDHALLSRLEAHGPEVSRVIGYTMAETYQQGDLVGDWYLFGRLLKLGGARNPRPLITLGGDQRNIRNTEAVLTPFGAEVLKGTASNYPENPIDDWAAGVKLSSEEGELWFNDGGKLVKSKETEVAMNQERPKPADVPDPADPRERNGTGEHADEQQLGITEEEVEDLEDDSKGG
jgi:Domain of unknown function (DUF1835)